MGWKTITTYVDLETGETLDRQTVLKYYNKIKYVKETKIENNGNYIIGTWECRKKKWEQRTIFN